MKKIFETIWRCLKSPQFILPVVGLTGFLADYLFKPISYVGLALLGCVTAPWIIQVLHKLKIGGLELELKPASTKEREENIKEEIEEAEASLAEPKSEEPAPVETKNIDVSPKIETPELIFDGRLPRERFIVDETKVLRKVASNFDYPLKQQVKLGPFYVDGIIDRTDWLTLIEVKLVYSNKSSLSQVESGFNQLNAMITYHNRNVESVRVDGLLAIGLAFEDERFNERLTRKIKKFRQIQNNIRIELFDIQ